jgi:hypothetical protein
MTRSAAISTPILRAVIEKLNPISMRIGGRERRRRMKREMSQQPSKSITRVLMLLAVAALAATVGAQSAGGSSSIDIDEVKNVGLSAANDAKSVIQVKWTAKLPPGTNVKSFDVSLEVQYADRTKERIRNTVSGTAGSARFEVPTLHVSPGRPAAELRTFEATVTANFSETATKQGSL